uniref:Uncharacterized protein n=1 Tax=Cacopsylla melanoneura TaxID=428564 RepID=A0A8D8ZVV5_9HEMI
MFSPPLIPFFLPYLHLHYPLPLFPFPYLHLHYPFSHLYLTFLDLFLPYPHLPPLPLPQVLFFFPSLTSSCVIFISYYCRVFPLLLAPFSPPPTTFLLSSHPRSFLISLALASPPCPFLSSYHFSLVVPPHIFPFLPRPLSPSLPLTPLLPLPHFFS